MTLSDDSQSFRAQLELRGFPETVVERLIQYHTPVNYGPGALVFRQGSAADIMFWIVKGMVREYCPHDDGSRILVRLAAPGDIIGCVDALDERGQRVRLFEAEAMSKCVLAMVTRQQILKVLEGLEHWVLVDLVQQLNAEWSSWLVHYVNFLGLSCRERIELVLRQLAERFGVKDKDGILLTFTPLHSDLAEMIGSSRPMVSRLVAMMVEEGVIARRGKQYVLLRDGGLASKAANGEGKLLARLPRGTAGREVRVPAEGQAVSMSGRRNGSQRLG